MAVASLLMIIADSIDCVPIRRSEFAFLKQNILNESAGIDMKFCLVDRITSLVPGQNISTIKHVSLAEEYLQDHFPGFSVLPGVMMVECLVQSCAWLSRVTDDFQYSAILLKQARAVKFNNFLKPGQTLEVTATMKSADTNTAEFVATGTVGGLSAVSAKLTLSKENLATRNPKLADNDARLIASMKELFQQMRSFE